MLSYQHIYHAGNMADVQKHLWLITVLQYLVKKDKPLQWIDTHAGRGLYDLQAPEAQKIKEYESGIGKFYSALKKEKELPPALEFYKNLIQDMNAKNELRHYPGSAYIAAKLLRLDDHLFCFDMHKGEFPHLEKSLKRFSHAHTRFEDGYKALIARVPPKQRRGGALIDPSYEVKDEYKTCARTVIAAHKKWPQGIYMIWYPILKENHHVDLLEPLKALNLPDEDFVIDEWYFKDTEKGMIGTGMVIINPPYGCAEEMEKVKLTAN